MANSIINTKMLEINKLHQHNQLFGCAFCVTDIRDDLRDKPLKPQK